MQNSFLALAHTKPLRCERFLNEMDKVIPWDQFVQEITPCYEQKNLGRNRKDLLMMLKIYFLQQWYALSDPEAEEQIYDRWSFQKFLGIDLLVENVPDETTILNFRHLLEEHQLQKRFFAVVNKLLEEEGLLMKEGTIVDATIITAPSSTKNKDKKRDSEMSSTKKGNAWFFGMKASVGVDDVSGLVHSLKTTTAKTHDKAVMEDLWHGKEKRKWGDKGYYDEKAKRMARHDGIYWGILDRAKRNHPLSASQKKRNKKHSSIRSKVEHPFQVLNCQWKYNKVRYRGLLKNTLQLFTLFSLINLFRVRKKLIYT
ncbi:MAG: IS5 family transposase [bacterium]|nr:IS5 family transposase [bacterium]